MSDRKKQISGAPLYPHGGVSLMHLVRRAGQQLTLSWSSSVTTGLTSAQYASLVVLAELGTCDQKTLGSRVSFDKATGSYVVERMSQSGLIECHTDPANRRSKLITLTPKGQDVLTATLDEARQAENMLAAQLLPTELATLKRVLSRMLGLEESSPTEEKRPVSAAHPQPNK